MNPNQHVKTYYKLIQCIHHEAITADQLDGKLSKAFINKNNQLNNFVKPAFPNSKLEKEIESINLNWTFQILASLNGHYIEAISNLETEIGNIPKEVSQESIDKALARAKKNFGKKLKASTIAKFKEKTKPPQTIETPTPGRSYAQAVQSPPPSPKRSLKETNMEILSPPRPSNNPTPPRQSNINTTHSNPGPSRQSNVNSKSSSTSMRKTTKNPTYKYATRSSAKIIPEKRQTNQPTIGKKTVHPNTKDKKIAWHLNPITHETLIIGDSNLKSINAIPNNTQIEAYPGAKINHIEHIIGKYPHYAPKPKQVIVNIGLNDHTNLPRTTKVSFDQMIRTLTSKFSTSNIYMPAVNIPPELNRSCSRNLKELNGFLASQNNIKPIPVLPNKDFQLGTDGYHWTRNTANKFIQHWISHLN